MLRCTAYIRFVSLQVCKQFTIWNLFSVDLELNPCNSLGVVLGYRQKSSLGRLGFKQLCAKFGIANRRGNWIIPGRFAPELLLLLLI